MTASRGYLTPEGGFSFECWFWRDAPPVSEGWSSLYVQRSQTFAYWSVGFEEGRQIWFGFAESTGALHLNAGSTGGVGTVAWTDPSPTGYQGDSQWHHVAVTLDADTRTVFKVFLDGELYATLSTLSQALSWTPGYGTIAGNYFANRNRSGKWGYDKRLAYFAMFDHELTANRIQEHYTAGSGGTVYYGEDEVVRLNRIFTWANVPEIARVLDEPVSVLQGIQVADTSALTQAQDTVESAGGYVFANGQAALEYHNRKHRYNRLAQLMVSDSDGSAPEIGVTFSTHEAYIYNDIRGTRPFGSQVRLQNDASVDANGRNVLEIDLRIVNPDELASAVSWLLARYGEDRVRVSEITFSCNTSRNLLQLAYGHVDIGDMFVIDELTDPAPLPKMEFTIEGLSVDSDWLMKKWDVTLTLTPNAFNRVFEVGATRLGSTDYIAY